MNRTLFDLSIKDLLYLRLLPCCSGKRREYKCYLQAKRKATQAMDVVNLVKSVRYNKLMRQLQFTPEQQVLLRLHKSNTITFESSSQTEDFDQAVNNLD